LETLYTDHQGVSFMAFDSRGTGSPARTAFVLSGGGSCGAAQVGMLRELARHGVRPDFIVGSSVGALNGAWFAASPTAEGVAQMETAWRGLRRRDVFPVSLGSVLRLVRRHESLVDPAPLRRLLERHLPCPTLEGASIPVHVVATDVMSGSPVRLSAGPTVEAVLASVAIPAVLPPVSVNGRLLMDGGVASNTPVDIALELGATRVIVLPTVRAYSPVKPPRSALEIGLHALSLLLSQQSLGRRAPAANAAQIHRVPLPDIHAISPFEFHRTAELIERSAECTRDWLRQGALDTETALATAPLPERRRYNDLATACA